jgi:hypothetical protein
VTVLDDIVFEPDIGPKSVCTLSGPEKVEGPVP